MEKNEIGTLWEFCEKTILIKYEIGVYIAKGIV